MVSMYECQHCRYSTGRKDTYARHQNSKKHLRNFFQTSDHALENLGKEPENVSPNQENVSPNQENVSPKPENVSPNQENVSPNQENVSRVENTCVYECKKCNKAYKTKEFLLNHETICSGIDSLTCDICMKTFAHRQSKLKHCKRKSCKPVSIFEAENVKSIINNNQSYNIVNNITNSNINNTNHITNIYVHDYGKERIDYLLDYDYFFDIIQRPNNNILVKYLKCKNFNPLFPENHSIKYENRCFKLKENNSWNLINPKALKDRLYNNCGSEVLNAFIENKNKIQCQIKDPEHFSLLQKKTDFFTLQITGEDKEIKNSMLDIVKDN
jgi:hypothetical protein